MPTSGATPAASQASNALSFSSLITTSANFSRGCPVIFSSSLARKYSAAREVEKIVRSNLCVLLVKLVLWTISEVPSARGRVAE